MEIFKKLFNRNNEQEKIEKNSISNNPIQIENNNITVIPELEIEDGNEQNYEFFQNEYKWFCNNKEDIIDKLIKLYTNYIDLKCEEKAINFEIYKITGISKNSIISEEDDDNFDIENELLYIGTTELRSFINKFSDSDVFLKIKLGTEYDDDAFSYAFINCKTNEILYFFHRF